MKTSELTGAALDWAVWSALGLPATYLDHNGHAANFSTQWAQGGPIIEREITRVENLGDGRWAAYKNSKDETHRLTGPTPLIAAMRCYVASKLGDEVDVPEELNGKGD